MAGDFNDNVRWDKPTKINKHSANVDALAALGLQSAYHHSRSIEQYVFYGKHLYTGFKYKGVLELTEYVLMVVIVLTNKLAFY